MGSAGADTVNEGRVKGSFEEQMHRTDVRGGIVELGSDSARVRIPSS